jgi:Ferritin-like
MPPESTSQPSSATSSSAPPRAAAGATPILLSKGLHETWLDHLILLLHVASGVEHELMVQYLYAAYSLGGDQVPADQHDLVRLWRRNLLAIAKEEMGHLLTVQNILTSLGAPISWARGNFPWASQYFPLRRYELSPLTMDSLSCYVYAEAPAKTAAVVNRYYGIKPEEVNRIIEKVRKAVVQGTPHRVEQLYAKIVSIIKNPDLIPDSAFHPETYTVQSSWEEWGKGYKPFTLDPETSTSDARAPLDGPAPPSSFPFPPTAAQARVILSQVATRTQVLAALKLVGEQGEAAQFAAEDAQPSHFDRFIGIYQKFENITQWSPTRQVPMNPTTWTGRPDCTYIESEYSRNWAHLFNLRYRMLLTYLSHMYRLPPANDSSQPQMRAGTLHRVFSEMYNLRSIASILVRLPLMDEKQYPNDPRRAGPPFELPYTLIMPAADNDCWHLHRELLVNSEILCKSLLPNAPLDGRQYLTSLLDLDRQSIAWIDAVLQGPASTRSSRS